MVDSPHSLNPKPIILNHEPIIYSHHHAAKKARKIRQEQADESDHHLEMTTCTTYAHLHLFLLVANYQNQSIKGCT